MRGFRVLVTAWLCGVAMSTAAYAADPAQTWPPEFKQPRYTDLISGWYVRADAGLRQHAIDSVDAPAANAVIGFSIDNAWTLGFGAGYKYKWFRTDVTLDYANKAKFFAETATGPGYFRAKIDSFTVLGNVYLDLGNWAGITPYVGAGIGGTAMRTHEFRVAFQLPRENALDTARWNFSWAAIGGVSYNISPKLLLDVNYRYLQLGDAISGTLPPAPNTARVTVRDMVAQEVRVGLRWMFD